MLYRRPNGACVECPGQALSGCLPHRTPHSRLFAADTPRSTAAVLCYMRESIVDRQTAPVLQSHGMREDVRVHCHCSHPAGVVVFQLCRQRRGALLPVVDEDERERELVRPKRPGCAVGDLLSMRVRHRWHSDERHPGHSQATPTHRPCSQCVHACIHTLRVTEMRDTSVTDRRRQDTPRPRKRRISCAPAQTTLPTSHTGPVYNAPARAYTHTGAQYSAHARDTSRHGPCRHRTRMQFMQMYTYAPCRHRTRMSFMQMHMYICKMYMHAPCRHRTHA